MVTCLEELITEAVMIRLDTTKLAGVLKKSATTRTDPITEADKELAAACARVDELGDMWAQDQITRAEFLRLGKPIRDRADAARRRLNSLVKDGRASPWAGQGGALRAAWVAMSLDQKRAVIDAVVERVVVNPTKIRGRFDPERVDLIWRV